MNIELPQTRPYGVLFVVGTRRSGGAPQTIGSIIVKAGFLLGASGGGDTHVMTPNSDAGASALVTADQGALIDNDPAKGMDVVREADLAPFKPLADIVVEGFVGGFNVTLGTADVAVAGTVWLARAAAPGGLGAASLADRNRHLFGYQPRTESPRGRTAADDAVANPNRFLNFYRRGGGFTAFAIADRFDNGQRIVVRKTGTEVLSVTLALPRLTALYRTWCGHGPDRAPYWTRISLGAMRADTLILRPDADSAEVIWRAVWPWADQPVDRYRAIRVSEESP